MRYRSNQSFKLTPVFTLIIINVVIFIGYLIDSRLFLNLFGLQGTGLLTYTRPILYEPWTIVTSMFVHAGFSHIIFNMLILYWFGTALSSLVGDKKFLLVYFCGGLLGNVLFLLIAPAYSVGVGASGAIYALGGALMVMRPQLKVYIFPLPVPVPLWLAIIIGFALSFVPAVAWQAHLGGLIFGLVAGYFFRRRERHFLRQESPRYWRGNPV